MHTSNPPAVSASNLLRELHSKSRDALSFPPDERRAVVEHLTLEGYSITEQAALLHVSDRTIQRDKHHIRAENAVFADDPGLTPRLVGDYLRQTEACLARIRRATRNSDVSARDRIYAEKTCHDILSKTLKVLQTIGYVQQVKPSATNSATEPPAPRLDPPPHEPIA